MDEIMEAMIERSNRNRDESTETFSEMKKAVEEVEHTERTRESGKPAEYLKGKYIRTKEGMEIYHIGKTKFIEMARDAGALYKIDRTMLVDVDIFEEYVKSFRVPGKFTA